MAYAALRASTDVHSTSVRVEHAPDTGFQLGWDHAHHGVVPTATHLHILSPVRQGWEAGRIAFGERTLAADRVVREWLQLRLHAWQRGRSFEATQVNPSFLRQIDVAACPVTREPLTHGTGALSDATVDRVCDAVGYAGGNLAVMSLRANRAKGACGPEEAMAFARQIEAGTFAQIGGLNAEHWARVAVLSSFCTSMPHARAAALPLLVLPPNRLRVLNPVQALQVMLSLQITQPGHGRRCAALAALMPTSDARQAFHPFMLTLLARRVAAGDAADAIDERRIVEDTWRDVLVHRRWQRLVLRLTAGDCERIVREAAERGLGGSSARWLGAQQATDGWTEMPRSTLRPVSAAQRKRSPGPGTPSSPIDSRLSPCPEQPTLCW